METVEQLVSFHHVQVQLSGGAPWGFTLKGGLEHGEPLLITKIEDGGKAALCRKLKLGDELININGSALYGSRQEALILIKGSYRKLRITVRRRSVPLIRPHSWHLAKLSDPPPRPPSCLPPEDAPPLPPPPPLSTMQLHPGPYTLAWHSSDTGDLSMQWGQMSRPYSSTDRSSSLGSMESLDTPTPIPQQYPDSHNSPVDTTLFNNKRDSAYSSFSASSNTSDYAAVPLRPDEACSMDNLLQNLGSACRGHPGGDSPALGRLSGEAPDESQLAGYKSRSLTRPKARPTKVKERPASCCYEEERRGGDFDHTSDKQIRSERNMDPPQPPTRKDSFRATQSRPEIPDKRCVSAPVGIPGPSSHHKEDNGKSSFLHHEPGIVNGHPPKSGLGDSNGNFKEDSVDCFYSQSQNKALRCLGSSSSLNDSSKDLILQTSPDHKHLPTTARVSPLPITYSGPGSLPSELPVESQGDFPLVHPTGKNSSSGLHRHSAPEKLLAQLQLLQFNADNSSLEPSTDSGPSLFPGSSHFSHSTIQPTSEDVSTELPATETCQNHLQTQHKWVGSRCSTPGSVFLEGEGDIGDVGERLEGSEGVVSGTLSPVQLHLSWGCSVSVPEDPIGSAASRGLNSDQVLARDFGSLSAAASVDTLLDEHRGGERGRSGEEKEEDVDREAVMKQLNSSRNLRRNRRRSERFATNLRNEIQRKKGQLQKSRTPGGLLCSGETVHEEEAPDLYEQGIYSQEKSTKAGLIQHTNSVESDNEALNYEIQPGVTTQNQDYDSPAPIQSLDPDVSSYGVSIRVVEEPAPAGKARRWRWTPEHKLQPEIQQNRHYGAQQEDNLLGVRGSRHGVCAFTASTHSFSLRGEESDILPFADRMKFFEETSRSGSMSSLPGSTGQRQKRLNPEDPSAAHQTQRRYSYQGEAQQENALLPHTMEARRQSISTSRDRQKERERERERAREREREERAREREWERQERARETERKREREREEQELRLQEIQMDREREERVREMEVQRARELELKREKELMERERTKELKREMEMGREQAQLSEYNQDIYRTGSQNVQDSLHDPQQPQPQLQAPVLSHYQAQNRVPRSAFHSVSSPSQLRENHGYTSRSCTPTEVYSARQQDTAPLNRKFSLTERDDPRWRCHSRPPEGADQKPRPSYPGRCGPPPAPLSLRGRAMSENDLLCDDTRRWSPAVSAATSQTLSEVEEGGGVGGVGPVVRVTRKKATPPPRPPPPKWEQFHRRRASHHTLLTPSPHPPHPSISPSPAPSPPVEPSRQRSYSLPPQRVEVAEGCRRCSRGPGPPRLQDHPWTHNQNQDRVQDWNPTVANQNQDQVQHCPYSSATTKQNQGQAQRHPWTNTIANQNQDQDQHHPYSDGVANQNQNQNQVHERPCPSTGANQNQDQVQDHPWNLTANNQDQDQVRDRPFTIAPPSPMFSRRTFRPVAPPPKRERDGTWRSTQEGQKEREELFPPPPTDPRVNSPGLSRLTTPRPAVAWERTPSPRVHSDTALPPSNGDSYFALSHEQQRLLQRGFQNPPRTAGGAEPQRAPQVEPGPALSPSPAHSLEAESDVPMETDIDDFQEEEGLPLEVELPCFALPVTVLETDLDGPPDPREAEGGAPGEETRMEGGGLEELLPRSGAEGSGAECWRGDEQSKEDHAHSSDRRSGTSSGSSSFYSSPAAMKEQEEQEDDLTYKKQLMESLRKKLGVLREAQRGLQDDIRANAQLGDELEGVVVAVCKPNEVDKFHMFIGDMDKVVSLLLSLSGRLLRVERALHDMEADAPEGERLPLLEKKRQLMRQLEEAEDLKEHVDRREQAVGRVLARCLSPEQHRDYSHFVKMKAALLVEQRQLEDKIRLGEEQLRGLRESLGLGLGMGLGLGLGLGMPMGYHY